MSGVLINGIQYEHCNECGSWVNIRSLFYEVPSDKFKYGRDLCWKCYKEAGHIS